MGLNLTAAAAVYLLDPWWNPSVEQQAIDRVHRLGQRAHAVVVRRLIVADSVRLREFVSSSTPRGAARRRRVRARSRTTIRTQSGGGSTERRWCVRGVRSFVVRSPGGTVVVLLRPSSCVRQVEEKLLVLSERKRTLAAQALAQGGNALANAATMRLTADELAALFRG